MSPNTTKITHHAQERKRMFSMFEKEGGEAKTYSPTPNSFKKKKKKNPKKDKFATSHNPLHTVATAPLVVITSMFTLPCKRSYLYLN